MDPNERPKLHIRQTFGEIFSALWHQRVDLFKLALPFVLIGTAILGVMPEILLSFQDFFSKESQSYLLSQPSLSNLGQYILRYIPDLHLLGWEVVLYILWIHGFFLIHAQKIEWPFSNKLWLIRYGNLALYGVLYWALSALGMMVITAITQPDREIWIWVTIFMSFGTAMMFVLIYTLLRLSFYEVGILLGHPDPFPFSWRLLKGNLLRLLVLLSAIELTSLGILLFMVRVFQFSGGVHQHPIPLFFTCFLFSCVYGISLLFNATLKAKAYQILAPKPVAKKAVTPLKVSPKKSTSTQKKF